MSMLHAQRLLTIAVALLATSVLAQPDRRANFDRWDADQNGQLSRDELPAGVRGNFDRLDANADGHITREEHDAFIARMETRSPNADRAQSRLPDDVRSELNIPYAGTDHPRQRLDLYLPKSPKSDRLPLVVFIHGGGWRNGDKAGGAGQVLPYVRSGDYAGASIGYRLSGDAQWPAQIHDCKAAIRWLRANAARYGIDPNLIGVMGSSAGGHLVAMLGTSNGVATVEGDLGDFDDADSRVTCVVDFFGPANMLTMGDFPSSIDHNSPDSPESKLLGGPVQEIKDIAREASPQSHVTSDDSPFLILHGTEDRTVPFDQSARFDQALRATGVESHLIRIAGGGHGGFNTPEVDSRVKAFLDQHLRGQSTEISTAPITAPPRPAARPTDPR